MPVSYTHLVLYNDHVAVFGFYWNCAWLVWLDGENTVPSCRAGIDVYKRQRKTDSQHYELLYEENESGEKELVGYKPTDRISDTRCV